MPEISERIFKIYEAGQAQSRNPHNFSVIGDCQAIPYVFLGPFERGELEPDNSESFLWDALHQFKGSFVRTGMAVRGGFTAASLLTSLQADPKYCLVGETPLTCEFRIHNPSIVFITLETWANPSTIDRYEKYLRRILDYVIDKGAIPILMTKADAAEIGSGVHVINPVIVKVALEYDVPLVNFWRSAQYLDNHGIDPQREGFHLSQEGYKLKNILALRALYMVWTAVQERENTVAIASNLTSPTINPTPQPTSTTDSDLQFTIPDCEGGCIYFGTNLSHDGIVSLHGVYALNYLTKALMQVLGDGFDLQDVSEDGHRLLVNDANRLYEINLMDNSTQLISTLFFNFTIQGAYWKNDDKGVVYIDKDQSIQTATIEAIRLFPYKDDEEIFFEGGFCLQKANCQSSGTYRLDSYQAITSLDSYSRLVFSPDGKLVAFLDPSAATKENYYHFYYLLLEDVQRGLASRRLFYFSDVAGFMVHPDVREYAFSSDSNKLFILYDVYSNYFEQSLRLQTYHLDLKTNIMYDDGTINGKGGSLNPRLIWSPDADIVLIFFPDMNLDNRLSINVYKVDVGAHEQVTPYIQGVLASDDYLYITNIYWR